MKLSPIVFLLIAMIGCGSGTQTTNPSAESGGNQAQQQRVATAEYQDVTLATKAPTEEPVAEKPVAAKPSSEEPSAETEAAAKTSDAEAIKKHMTPAQLALGDPIVNSIGMVLVPIPAGEFQMGSSISAEEIVKRFDLPEVVLPLVEREHPQHLVKITKPFYLSVSEVTQEQYEKVMGDLPWQGKNSVTEGPDYAASYISWNDAAKFCRKLSEQEGVEYRLPTEAQWEYACRAGTETAYSFGDDSSMLGQYGWHRKHASATGKHYAHAVGQKLPNPWGLFDMHGNVIEWCQDWYTPYGSEKPVSDPGGSASRGGRVLRGGSFFITAAWCRSAIRSFAWPDLLNLNFGFRVSRTYN